MTCSIRVASMGTMIKLSGMQTWTWTSGNRFRNRPTAEEMTSSRDSSVFITVATPRSSWILVTDSRFSTMVSSHWASSSMFCTSFRFSSLVMDPSWFR